MVALWLAFTSTALIALSLEAIIRQAAKAGLLSTPAARKSLHVAMGPVFMACWPLFEASITAAAAAAAIPLLLTVKFLLVGLGILDDKATVGSMSRSGDRRELLYGPLQYGIVFTASTFLFWKTTPAVVSLLILCFGDAAAETAGRQFGRRRLPFPAGTSKTFVGSGAFFAASFLGTMLFSRLLAVLGGAPLVVRPDALAVVCAAATVAEMLSPVRHDNVVVFAVAAPLAFLLL